MKLIIDKMVKNMSGFSNAVSGMKRKLSGFQGYLAGGDASVKKPHKEAQQQETNFWNLNNQDVILRIFDKAISRPRDVTNLALVCKGFNDLVNRGANEFIWQKQSRIEGFSRFEDCTWKKSYYLNSKISYILNLKDETVSASKQRFEIQKKLLQLKEIKWAKNLIESTDENSAEEKAFKALALIELVKINPSYFIEIWAIHKIIIELHRDIELIIELRAALPDEGEYYFNNQTGCGDNLQCNDRLKFIKALLQTNERDRAMDIMEGIKNKELKILAKIEFVKDKIEIAEMDEIEDLINKITDKSQKSTLQVAYVTALIDLILSVRPFELQNLKVRVQNIINDIDDEYYKALALIQCLRAYPNEIKKAKKLINDLRPPVPGLEQDKLVNYLRPSVLEQDKRHYPCMTDKYLKAIIELIKVKPDERENAENILKKYYSCIRSSIARKDILKHFVEILIRSNLIKEARDFTNEILNRDKLTLIKPTARDFSAQLDILKFLMQHRF